jgi:hypothetical protein
MSLVDAKAPLAGHAGLHHAVAKGLLRPATEADVDAWMAVQRPVIAKTSDLPPVAGASSPEPRRPRRATFVLPRGVPQPGGNPGHSKVYDFNKDRCRGPGCTR